MTTIFAPITSISKAGVGVIRISGEETVNILKKLGLKKELEHQRIYYHKILNPKDSNIIDESLISFFKAPNSLTGEDVAEINIHASPFILKSLMEILCEIKNVRFAEAGEFLKRAFLNGKIDLVKAEAVPDLIAAESKAQHLQAIRQLSGKLGDIYESWREKLINISAKIEAFIDFPDEDLPEDLIDKIENEVKNLAKEIKNHLDDKNIGQKIKNGLNLAIIGLPNVGKSSLINFLTKSEVAIVSDIAGTTRDVLETHLSIAGVVVKIADTAGLRQTQDVIEQEGIKRALKKAKEADLKIFVLDALNPVLRKEDEEIIDENTIFVINKIDLSSNLQIENEKIRDLAIKISLKNATNTNFLIKKLEEKVLQMLPALDYPVITQERYRVLLKEALNNLEMFNLSKNIELAAEDLRMTAREIGKITGKIDVENILDVIFSSFCIGK